MTNALDISLFASDQKSLLINLHNWMFWMNQSPRTDGALHQVLDHCRWMVLINRVKRCQAKLQSYQLAGARTPSAEAVSGLLLLKFMSPLQKPLNWKTFVMVWDLPPTFLSGLQLCVNK